MYFPWVGLLEQIRLADVFVFYDDVQFARGFFNRVQIKTPDGVKWLTIPLKNWHRGQLINEVVVDESINWRHQQREMLRHSYARSPYYRDLLDVVEAIFSRTDLRTIADYAIESTRVLSDFFSLSQAREFLKSSNTEVTGRSSERLRDLVASLNGDVYITGHGARNYLDHEIFVEKGIDVKYMDYQCRPYPQLHGDFTPYVSALDLVANCGIEGRRFICSEAIDWKEFVNGRD